MSGLCPLIYDWRRLGLRWGYISQQVLTTKTLAPNTEIQLPTQDYVFRYVEGVLLNYTAVFDDPSCGLRIELNPDFDSEQTWTVTNLVNLGLTRVENIIYTVMPPVNPAGRYTVRVCGPWLFEDWMRLHIFNPDSSSHNLLTHSYDVAVLKQKRPNDSIVPLETMKKIQLAYEMYPEIRGMLRTRLSEKIDAWLKEVGIEKLGTKKE